jgi:hypothetical protein
VFGYSSRAAELSSIPGDRTASIWGISSDIKGEVFENRVLRRMFG